MNNPHYPIGCCAKVPETRDVSAQFHNYSCAVYGGNITGGQSDQHYAGPKEYHAEAQDRLFQRRRSGNTDCSVVSLFVTYSLSLQVDEVTQVSNFPPLF